MAAAVKDAAWVNHHARRMNFPRYDTFGLNFNAAFCENHAVKAAGNHYPIPFDLSFDFGAFAENHGLFGNNVAAHVTVMRKVPVSCRVPSRVTP